MGEQNIFLKYITVVYYTGNLGALKDIWGGGRIKSSWNGLILFIHAFVVIFWTIAHLAMIVFNKWEA